MVELEILVVKWFVSTMANSYITLTPPCPQIVILHGVKSKKNQRKYWLLNLYEETNLSEDKEC